MKKKIAIILAGCGKADGSEIHETTLTLLSIDQQGAEYHAFAPNISQKDVVNHLTGETMQENRNVLVESARIVRGEITELKEYNPKNYDALILPGGFGAAKNLCSFATDQEAMNINEEVLKAIKETHQAGKPIGALCIAPVIIAKALKGTKVTLGANTDIVQILNKWGSSHEETSEGEITVDTKNKIVTTPCYMLDSSIGMVYEGAKNLVRKILELA